MTRPSTLRWDQRILKLYRKGIDPKIIVIRLRLANVWRVYDALKRNKNPDDQSIDSTNENG